MVQGYLPRRVSRLQHRVELRHPREHVRKDEPVARSTADPGARNDLAPIVLSVVREHRRRPGYRLLAEDEFAIRLVARAGHLAGRAVANDPSLREQLARLAQNICAETLCQACLSPNPREQNQGYAELGAYLYRLAFNALKRQGRPTDLAEDCTQEALRQVWQHIERCREPGAFLRWAAVIQMRIVQRHLRRQRDDLLLPEED